MPNPTSHMFLIHDLFESNIESKTYLKFMILGSITPDIRVITKIHRKKYHYFDLAKGKKGDGMKGFIKNNDLLPLQQNNIETYYFNIGYISHLIADENWTIDIFRKIFMNAELFPDFHEALFLDRAIQIFLDIKLSQNKLDIYKYLQGIDFENIDLPNNITKSELTKWIDFLIKLNFDFLLNPWKRLDFMAARLSKTYNSNHILCFSNKFKDNLDENIDDLIDKISYDSLESYIVDTQNDINKISKDFKI